MGYLSSAELLWARRSTFHKDVLHSGSEQHPAPVLLDAPYQGIHNAPGAIQRIVYGGVATVALHEHERHLHADSMCSALSHGLGFACANAQTPLVRKLANFNRKPAWREGPSSMSRLYSFGLEELLA